MSHLTVLTPELPWPRCFQLGRRVVCRRMAHVNSSPPQANPETESAVQVYAVYGAEPEVQAYAMAKYSRSALSMKESLAEINAQKAEAFLDTFYFQ